jgi:transposase
LANALDEGTVMGRFIEGEDRQQVLLLPECLDDYVAEDNPVRVIDAKFDLLDRSRIDDRDAVKGQRTPAKAS